MVSKTNIIIRRIALSLALVISAAGIINAQYSNFSSQSRFGDNLSIGLEFGTQTNLNEWKTPQGAIIGINLNKDLTPYFGLSLEGVLGLNNNPDWFVELGSIEDGAGVNNLSGFITGRWNVTNTVCGFKGYRRAFEVETNVGVGYGRFYPMHQGLHYWNGFQVKTGLNFNIFVEKTRCFAINIRPAVLWNVTQTGQFDSRYAVAQLSLGFSYHFKTSNGTHYFVKSDVSQLEEELAALTSINGNLQNQWDNRPILEKEVFVEKVVESAVPTKPKYVEMTYIVNFALNSSSLLGNAKSELDKIPSNSTVEIAGYASPEGPEGYNKSLSQQRADSVKKYLESRGVKVTKAVGYGATNPESNRLVIVNVL